MSAIPPKSTSSLSVTSLPAWAYRSPNMTNCRISCFTIRQSSGLFMVEAVTSHEPVSPKRHQEIESFLGRCQAERVYVTAFLSIAEFRKYAADIAWETEVWIAATPDHMIHFNGPKFLGPHNPQRTG
jgi:hypothetical protein